jgi:predicted dehydrogenase
VQIWVARPTRIRAQTESAVASTGVGTLRVGVVGMGIGQSHLLAWMQVGGADAVAFAEIDEERRVRGAADWGLPAVASLEELIDPTSPHHVDIVDLCTPPWLHEEQIAQCLHAGVHVICEKPLVDSVAACDRIAEAVDRAAAASGARFMPIFQYRFGDGAARARALIDAGITGRLFTASSSTWWRRGRAYYADAAWRGTWAGERGGCVLSHAIHNHDLLTWMAGPLVELRAMTATRVNDVETEDCAVAIGRTIDGGLVTMNVTLGAASESSQLVWHFDNVTITSSSEAYDPAAGPWNFEFRRSAFAEEAERVWADLRPTASQYVGQFQGFLDALADGTELPVTLDDARASLELVTAWYHSARTGSVETLPLAVEHPARASWLPEATR